MEDHSFGLVNVAAEVKVPGEDLLDLEKKSPAVDQKRAGLESVEAIEAVIVGGGRCWKGSRSLLG